MVSDSVDSALPDETWEALAEWLSKQPAYVAENCCAWCEFVGDASVLTDRKRLDSARRTWALLATSPFADELRRWAPELEPAVH